MKEASSLHRQYRFEEAISLYNKLLSATTDSLTKLKIDENIIQCENGISLLQYAVTPNVIAKKSVPVENFYLHFSSLQDKTWMPIPNPMIAVNSHPYYSAVYFPEGQNTVYYSAPDNSGSWNIYQISQISDTLWAEPKILGENITSSGDEIFPLLSNDGKELYFASNGHYGMGGYDLYVSRWDEDAQDWGVPENLGFPYSSTADDILYLNSFDGQYSILASNRDAANKEEITLYAIEYIPTTIKKELSDIKEIQSVAKLDVAKSEQVAPKAEADEKEPEPEGMSDYAKLVSQMRILRKELDNNIAKQDESRLLYERVTNEDDREFLKEEITDLEAKANDIRARLDQASAKVQAAELEFLAKGIIPQFEAPEDEEKGKTQTTAQTLTYQFANNTFRDVADMNIEVPEPEFDYSFKILDEAQFAEDNTLPNGLVYQIQLMVVSNKAGKKSFKGMSPIFENKQPSGKYLYTVGLWRTHAEALKHLNQVRKRGFPKAYIIAYNNGKTTSVKNARVLEKQKAAEQSETSYQVLLKGYPDGIPTGILTAIRDACDKDLAKATEDGQTIYMVGPFSKKEEADNLKTLLFGLGAEGISVEPIKK